MSDAKSATDCCGARGAGGAVLFGAAAARAVVRGGPPGGVTDARAFGARGPLARERDAAPKDENQQVLHTSVVSPQPHRPLVVRALRTCSRGRAPHRRARERGSLGEEAHTKAGCGGSVGAAAAGRFQGGGGRPFGDWDS